MADWIPVEEKLPGRYTDVMVTGDFDYREQDVCIAFVDRNEKWTENGGYAFHTEVENVTAWRQIPKLLDVEETQINEWRFICDELPKDGEICLVSHGEFGSYATSMARFYLGDRPLALKPKGEYGFVSYLDYEQLDDDIAWMPLPKPYNRLTGEEKC